MQEKDKTENELKKEFLMSYQIAKRDIIRLEEQLAELRINKVSPSCDIGDGMPHGSDISDLSDYMSQVDELERKIVGKRYERIKAFQKIQMAIEEIQVEREKDVLTYRYIRNLKWEEICVIMNYKWRQIHRIHSSALKKIKMA